MNDQPLRKALRLTLQGLQTRIPAFDESDSPQSWQALRWMVNQSLDHVDEWPTDKTSRWIGYVQGCLACRNFLDVNAERDRTRPFFHEAYEAMGINIPKTTERS